MQHCADGVISLGCVDSSRQSIAEASRHQLLLSSHVCFLYSLRTAAPQLRSFHALHSQNCLCHNASGLQSQECVTHRRHNGSGVGSQESAKPVQ
jgi:hypothetical protein